MRKSDQYNTYYHCQITALHLRLIQAQSLFNHPAAANHTEPNGISIGIE